MWIRPLTPQDSAIYTPFILRGVAEHPECFRITVQDVLDSPDPLLATHPDDFTLGAFSDDGILQGALCYSRETREKMHHKGLLHRMYVAAEASANGMGRALMRQAIARARAQAGLEQVTLTVLDTNLRAKQLYLSEGFEVFSLERNAVKTGDEYWDEQQMVLYLT